MGSVWFHPCLRKLFCRIRLLLSPKQSNPIMVGRTQAGLSGVMGFRTKNLPFIATETHAVGAMVNSIGYKVMVDVVLSIEL